MLVAHRVVFGRDYRVNGRVLSGVEVYELVAELQSLCRNDVLRNDREWDRVERRKRQILEIFGVAGPEDVFDEWEL